MQNLKNKKQPPTVCSNLTVCYRRCRDLFNSERRACSKSEASMLNKLVLSHIVRCTEHCVYCLFAMSSTLIIRKCFALASLFACGQPGGAGVRQHRCPRIYDMREIPRFGNKKALRTECLICWRSISNVNRIDIEYFVQILFILTAS